MSLAKPLWFIELPADLDVAWQVVKLRWNLALNGVGKIDPRNALTNERGTV